MRFAGLAFGALMSVGAAWAQDADGRASISGKAAEALIAAGDRVDTRAEMRAIIQVLLAEGSKPETRDLLVELASGRAFTAEADGRKLALGETPDDVAMLPRTLLSPPNLNGLWCVNGAAADQMVEMARWSPASRQRIANFFGAKLAEAWSKSTEFNRYEPYSNALACAWDALESLPEDPEARALGHDLLTAGIRLNIEQFAFRTEGAPKEHLYSWITPEASKRLLVEGKQKLEGGQ